VRGEAHDENAFAMGGCPAMLGCSRHAQDVREDRRHAGRWGKGFLPRALVQQAHDARGPRAGLVASARVRRLRARKSGGGSKLSAESFGHTGSPGTSLRSDRAAACVIVLLTNACARRATTRGIDEVRRALCDLVVASTDPR
jgi:CubicO group peptidase (beta-lactamase class C family)